ncbi:MAG: hypothetical protein ACYTEQ_05275 [Planctomycetota bacterium]|jgi:hypothetical protein
MGEEKKLPGDERMSVGDVADADAAPGESVFDQMPENQPVAFMSKDGLPVEKDPPWNFSDALPPPLAPETMCCLDQEPNPDAGRHVSVPRCRWYARQRYATPKLPGIAVIDRFCAAPPMRGLNGAALVLKDCAMFQCEFRDPVDPAAQITLDAIDSDKIAIGKQRMETEGIAGGKYVVGYRMFKTTKDVEEERTVLEEEDFSEVSDE